MTDGPPSSVAESSASGQNWQSTHPIVANLAETPRQPNTTPVIGSTPYYNYGSWPANWPASATGPKSNQPYLPPPYTPQAYQAFYGTQNPSAQQMKQPEVLQTQKDATLTSKTMSPSTSPPPIPVYRHWDEVIKNFLTEAGLMETLRAFESDMLVLSPDWEEEKIPKALQNMVSKLTRVQEYPAENRDVEMKDQDDAPTLDERKLNYIHLANDQQPRSQTSVNKSISAFLANNRARNNVSNRIEFLYGLAEKRHRMQSKALPADPNAMVSCARADAKPIDRDEQMKYDIAKNQGPLTRTRIQKDTNEDADSTSGVANTKKSTLTTEELLKQSQSDDSVTPTRYPALDERLRNIETHFAVRYVPSPPRNLLARLKHLEDHIIRLEKEYPPWAALHFNQPNRGWPPPPRSTPIIVPPHLRSIEKDPVPAGAAAGAVASTSAAPGVSSNMPKQRKNKSSLHRAVMERLEVQRAMDDLGNVPMKKEPW